MGRHRLPSPTLAARYEQGPPKRVRVTLRTAEGQTLSAGFSTRDARGAVAVLVQAIDLAEADKIAARGDPTRKARPPKRDGSRGITKAKGIRPPSRAKRIEAAAVDLAALARSAEHLPDNIRPALAALIDAVGVQTKGPSR